MYDSEKNEKKRAELVRSCFLNDRSLVVPILKSKDYLVLYSEYGM